MYLKSYELTAGLQFWGLILNNRIQGKEYTAEINFVKGTEI
jgi:hypothetical protein